MNTRIQSFTPNTVEHTNKPPEISLDRLKNKIDLKISAAEMLYLVQYFGLIIGDLIPRDDQHWNLYKSLSQVTDIALSPRVTHSHAKTLLLNVERLNKIYIELYRALKPKFHHMTHYARILLMNGPLINFWSMRFESRHRPVKSAAQSTNSNTNLLKTIATKQALKMFEMMNALQFEEKIKWGQVHSNAKRDYFVDETKNKKSKYFMSVKINGTHYEIGSVEVVSLLNSEIEFGEIVDIVFVDNEVYFYLKIFVETTFDFHVHAYITEITTNCTNKLLKFENLPVISPVTYIVKNNIRYVSTRYGL